MTIDLNNVQPVNKQADPDVKPVNTGTEDTDLRPDIKDTGPAPTTEQRKAAAKEKEEAEAKAKADAEAKAAEAAKDGAEDDKPKKGELDTSIWGEHEDEVTVSVMTTLQDAGVTPTDAKALLWDAVEAGDPTKIDRDALVEKVGKAQATLIMAGITNITERNNKKLAEVLDISHKAAGGPDNWKKAASWALKGIPEGDLAEYRDMLEKGGKAATFAAGEIVKAYNADPKNTALSAGDALVPDTKASAKVEGITLRQYGERLIQLERKGASQAEFNALRAQRAAGKKQGI